MLPSCGEKYPGEHGRHVAVPAAGLYVPGIHTLHADGSDVAVMLFAVPARHITQSVRETLPAAVLYVPTGHASNDPLPGQ